MKTLIQALCFAAVLLTGTAQASTFWESTFNAQDCNWRNAFDNSCLEVGNGVVQIATDIKHEGAGSVKYFFDIPQVGSCLQPHVNFTDNCNGYWNRTITESSTLWQRFWLYIGSDFVGSEPYTKITKIGANGWSDWLTFTFGNSTGLVMGNQGWPDAGSTRMLYTNANVTRGTWTCIEIGRTMNTPGVANGTFYLYQDGVQKAGYVDVGWRLAGDNTLPNIARLYRQYGSGTLRIDQYAVGDTRIGCGSGAPATDTTPPPIPAAPTVSAQTLPLTVNWTGVSNPGDLAGYKYYRKLQACSGSGSMTFSTTLGDVLTYSDTNIPNSTTNVCIKISSYDSSGNESSQSSGLDVSLTPPAASVRNQTISDTFSAGNSNPAPSPWQGGYTPDVNFQVLSGQLAPVSTSADAVMTRNETTPDDQYFCIDLSTYHTNTYPGVLLRFAAPPTKSGYEFRLISGTSARIGRWDTGTLAVLTSASYVPQATDKICGEAEGTTLRFYYERSGVSTLLVTATDPSYTSGLRGAITNNQAAAGGVTTTMFDNATGGDFGSGTPTGDTFANVATLTADPFGADITFTGSAHKIRYWNALHPRGSEVEVTGLSGVTSYRHVKTWEVDPTLVDWVCYESQGSDGVWSTDKDITAFICDSFIPRNPVPNKRLEVCPLNTRWICTDEGHAIWLGGISGGDVGDAGTGICNPAFCGFLDLFRDSTSVYDFTTGLANDVIAYGMNLVRIWAYEQKTSGTSLYADGTYLRKPNDQFPWVCTGTRTDTTTGYSVVVPVCDLNQWNEAFFTRMGGRVDEVLAANLTPVVMLWSSGHLEYFGYGGFSHPFSAGNNVNGINADVDADGKVEELRTTTNPTIVGYQEAYMRKMVDTMATRNGIIWEFDNEGQQDYTTFYNRAYDVIKQYEPTVRSDGQSNLILSSAYNFGARVNNSYLSGSTKNDAIGPSCTTDGTNYDTAPPANDGTKIVIYDTDHAVLTCGTITVPTVYKNFMRANNLIYLDEREDSSTRTAVKNAIGYSISMSKRTNLKRLVPVSDSSIFSTSYGLYDSCSEYVMYMENDGSSSIDLTGCSGTFSVEYQDLSTGVFSTDSNVSGGASRSFNPAGSTAQLVHLRLIPGDVTAPTAPTGFAVQ